MRNHFTAQEMMYLTVCKEQGLKDLDECYRKCGYNNRARYHEYIRLARKYADDLCQLGQPHVLSAYGVLTFTKFHYTFGFILIDMHNEQHLFVFNSVYEPPKYCGLLHD